MSLVTRGASVARVNLSREAGDAVNSMIFFFLFALFYCFSPSKSVPWAHALYGSSLPTLLECSDNFTDRRSLIHGINSLIGSVAYE